MDYFGDGWQSILSHNGLDSFDALWNLEVEWVEEPNVRRGGWSGVARIWVTTPAGECIRLFLKRQQNHFHRSLWHPIRGGLTFAREFNNIRRFEKKGIPTLEPVFLGQRRVGKDVRAILVTQELTGFAPLTSEQFAPRGKLLCSIEARKALFKSLAALMRQTHADNRQHGSLQPKHIFARQADHGGFEVRVIDLEKTRWHPLKQHVIFRDLYTLAKFAPMWSITDRMRFFLIYRQEVHLSSQSKKLWQAIARKLAAKKAEASKGEIRSASEGQENKSV